MSTKNIWIINQYTGSPYHGMNYRSYYLAKEFIQMGHKVTIFSGSFSHLFSKLPETRGLYTTESIDGINYIWIKTPKYKSSKSIKRFVNMFVFSFLLLFINLRKINKPDEIIISSLSIFPVINAFLWSKKFDIEFIFEVRDLWPRTLVDLASLSWKHPLVVFLKWFEKFGYDKSKFIVSVLPNAIEHMKEIGNYENKFRYIPNGVLIKNNNIESLNEELLLQVPTDKFILGYVGTIGIANALEYLIDAAIILRNNTNILFVIVGSGGEKNKLLNKVKKENLDNVIFINNIPKNQVPAMLNLFDLLFIGWHKKDLYKYGISANKLFDYMLSGKPILNSISIENDIVELSACGWKVPAEDSKEIAKKIVEISKMDNLILERKGNNGLKYVKKYHDYKYLAKQYEELFR